jgi:hypothetical protein
MPRTRLPTRASSKHRPALVGTPGARRVLASAGDHAHADEGRYASVSEMAAAERLDRGYLGRVLQLTLLAPDIVEAILDGRQQADLGLPASVGPFPLEWDAQRTALAGAPVPA